MTSPKSPVPAEAGTPVLRLTPGMDLVASTVEGQRELMMKTLEPGTRAVVLDLKGVEQMDSLGITLVLGLFKTCQRYGARFSIEGVPPGIMRVFRLFNLPKFFPIVEG